MSEKIWEYPLEKKCPTCGKTFCIRDKSLWGYYRNLNGNECFFCSWSCLQKYLERREKKGKQGKLNKQRQKVILEMLAAGYNYQCIAAELDVSKQMVKYYANKYQENLKDDESGTDSGKTEGNC